MSTTNTKHGRNLTDALEYVAAMDRSRPFQPGDVRAMMLALSDQLASVTAQRDQCREALRDYMGNNGSGPKSCGHMAHCVCPYDKARAALRACENGGAL